MLFSTLPSFFVVYLSPLRHSLASYCHCNISRYASPSLVLSPNERRREEKRMNANGESRMLRRGEGIYNKDERTSSHPSSVLPFSIALGSVASLQRIRNFVHAHLEFDIPQSTFNEWLP